MCCLSMALTRRLLDRTEFMAHAKNTWTLQNKSNFVKNTLSCSFLSEQCAVFMDHVISFIHSVLISRSADPFIKPLGWTCIPAHSVSHAIHGLQ